MTMSFFGKLKNLHSGPPAPPKRTDNNAGFGWPQDEFDDEEGDMYEAPPCERPAMKVPQRQVEENVYLERTSSPAVPQRQAAPPPRAGKALKPLQRANVFSYEANTRKPPEIDRTEKPGRNKMMPPPPVRSVPAPVPVSNTEEDVYLDPNEEQEDNDDLYLEPTAACAPPPRGPMRPMPPSPKTALVPSPIPMMKPPVPRAKSNSFLPSLNEVKTAPSVEARRATFPTKLPPPTPSVKPPLPANLKEAKPRVKSGLPETATERQRRTSYRGSTRTVPSSSVTARLRTPASLSPWLCSTSRRCTIFPSASWRRHKATPWEKRARRTKRFSPVSTK
ncbi:pollen-specific leucine-rich repeat extensin-like protein 1 isoform X2 [Seriola lalandi dorsalis]|uniref:pollen-specific leucine-rich repeat extensin-like protein 1 isoform X2 n=1 Tax=Seriola lalandi dorsalis TaxID=1841481 RepID=UPI000C6F705D|nr:pollen-specific leucine-rich repeat extensin-like protein 1 isoform X2 [Seriola lalandi dorsalis]